MIKNQRMNGRGLLVMGDIFKANVVLQGQFNKGKLVLGKCKIESEKERVIKRKLEEKIRKTFYSVNYKI